MKLQHVTCNLEQCQARSRELQDEQHRLETQLQKINLEQHQLKKRIFEVNEENVKKDDELKMLKLERKFHVSNDIKENITYSIEVYFLAIENKDGEDAKFINSSDIQDYVGTVYTMVGASIDEGCKDIAQTIINATGAAGKVPRALILFRDAEHFGIDSGGESITGIPQFIQKGIPELLKVEGESEGECDCERRKAGNAEIRSESV
ncbi:unnamed protein product [Didymodactylos carnosus]|uniref:Uncharacterized protein n=1 Tax=Didymodactylos carnosus TaxID=1234261 RepID=A0A813YWV5_9BILA|nr:unnamed protein product [Didymodactylos carnosus]CAF3675137.1 unnamed protein product [Didymodactylos carnosus]